MKKTILLLVSVVLFASCKNDKTQKEETTETVRETVEIAEDTEVPVLLGVQNRKAIESKPHRAWFVENYMYQADQQSLAGLHSSLDGITITIFMGTWCEDSQTHVPAVYSILDAIKYDSEKVTLIAMSEDKDTPENLEEGMDIHYVPTIILYKNGQELGRIVEFPVESLEADMLAIAKGEEYKHTYED